MQICVLEEKSGRRSSGEASPMPEKSHSCTVALHFYLLVHVLHLGG